MQRLLLTVTLLIVSTSVFAKKVKFAVDMGGQDISPAGIHVSGDFQTLAGFPGGDWNSASTPLTKEGNTSIYSIVVTVPAFRKYEYKFVNGDQFYEAEFVPEPSRIGHDFNDNRWIYVDSLSSDTFFVGAIRFGGNAPAGLQMVRFKADLNYIPQTNAVHLAASFNGWSYQNNIMYRFVDKLFEVIQFVPLGTYTYRFANGNTIADAETVPTSCADANGERMLQVQTDTVLEAFCFGSCSACLTPVSETLNKTAFGYIYPNPAKPGEATLSLPPGTTRVEIADALGRKVQSFSGTLPAYIKPEKLSPGFYRIWINAPSGTQFIHFVVQ